MKNPERRLQLTSKFVQMGKALVEEGREKEDPIIAQLGSMIIFLGGICFDDEDVMKFGDLVSMYSAKKLVESLEEDRDPVLMAIRKKAESLPKPYAVLHRNAVRLYSQFNLLLSCGKSIFLCPAKF